MSKFPWDQLRFVREIGSGASGLVHEVTVGDDATPRRYAHKLEKITIDGIRAIAQSAEMAFYKKVAESPELQIHCVRMVAHRITRRAHTHTPPEYLQRVLETERYKALARSPYCIEWITELAGESLLVAELSARKWRQIAGDVVDTIICVRAAGFSIRDLHFGNLCIWEGASAGVGSPTRVKLIDYTDMIRAEDDPNFAYNYDLLIWIYKLCGWDQFFISYTHSLPPRPRIELLRVIDQGGFTEAVSARVKKINPNIDIVEILHQYDAGGTPKIPFVVEYIFGILYPGEMTEYWCRSAGTSFPPPKSLISAEDANFMLENYSDMAAISSHLHKC